MDCGYGHGECKAPDTQCPHWKGTFCELDMMTRVIDKFDKVVKEHPEIIEEVLFWNRLGMTLCSCDLKTSRELNDWVGDVLFTNYPEYYDKLSEYHNAV